MSNSSERPTWQRLRIGGLSLLSLPFCPDGPKLPIWLQASSNGFGEPHYGKAGRPSAQAEPVRMSWKNVPSLLIDQEALQRAADQLAAKFGNEEDPRSLQLLEHIL